MKLKILKVREVIIMEKKHCDNEECKNYWSCKYLKHRFNVKECDPNKFILIDTRHFKELKEREELLNKPR